MVLCDTAVKNQVKAISKFKDIDKKLDSMTLLKAIKKLYILEEATIYT